MFRHKAVELSDWSAFGHDAPNLAGEAQERIVRISEKNALMGKYVVLYIQLIPALFSRRSGTETINTHYDRPFSRLSVLT